MTISQTIIMDNIMTVRIALAQYTITPGDSENNWLTGLSAIRQAASQRCNLVQLPELWLSGYDLTHTAVHASTSALRQSEIQALANSLNIHIGGSVITRRDNWFYNTYQLFQPRANRPFEYSKTHLFRLLDEQTYLKAGDKLAVADLPWGKVGLALCYDMRFPELIRAYTDRGIACLLVAAEWGQKRSEHWRTLLRARAIENQIFVIATNAVGPIFENQLAGFSAIIDPWGNTLAEAGPSESTLVVADIDLTEIERVRQVVPSTTDRRTELYQRWQDAIE